MTTQILVNRVIQWLRKNGQGNDTNRYLRAPTEPYMQFMAEWQRFPSLAADYQRLAVGYSTVINGDVCFDPLLLFDLEGEEITNIVFQNDLVGARMTCEDQYASEFLSLVLDRHFT